MFVREFDKDVFQRGGEGADFGDDDALLQQLIAQVIEVEVVIDKRVDGLAKDGGSADAGDGAGEAQSAGYRRSGDCNTIGAGGMDVGHFAQGIGRAVGDELTVIKVGDVAAALGFVHVVGGDEKGDAVGGKL